MIYKKRNENSDLITHLTSKRMNKALKMKSGEEMERRSQEDENDAEIGKEWRRNGEAFIGVEVDTKNREAWRRNGSKRRSPEAPKLKWKRESSA